MHAVEEYAGGDGHIPAQSQRVVLIDPGVVARLDARLRQACEARARKSKEAPTLRTVIAGCFGAVQWPLAFAAVETAQMTAAQRHPDDAVAIDVGSAHTEAGQRHVEDLRELRAWIEA